MALSAMMTQYLEIKQKHKDEILLFRVGDFYEMFFDDAKVVSRELDLTLTGKDCGLEERAPMCGVPYHAVEIYVAKLISKGFRVAICDQLTDPALSKGIVERDVTRVITPGTVIESNMLQEKDPSYIMSAAFTGTKAGIAFSDISTGEFFVYSVNDSQYRFEDELARIMPKELLTCESERINSAARRINCACTGRDKTAFEYAPARKALLAQFSEQKELIGELDRASVQAAGALIRYLCETQMNALMHINRIQRFETTRFMLIDHTVNANLELTKSLRDGTRKGSLLGVIDKTVTAMGGRLLKNMIEEPLLDADMIKERLDAVECFVDDPVMLDAVRTAFDGVHDIERLLSRIAYGNINPRDCIALCETLKAVPAIKALLDGKPGLIGKAAAGIDEMSELTRTLEAALDDDAPIQIKEGGIFKSGFNDQLDKYREASVNGKNWLNQLEQKERDETGIKNLKIGYTRLFGYYIEVTKSFYELVPLRYTRKQTLANCERFITEELKQLENTILGADENAVKLEYELFLALREELKRNIERIRNTADSLKTIDVLQALAKTAAVQNYVRPGINSEGRYSIKNGRHAVVEQAIGTEHFVPNDVYLDEDARVMIITGPNMAGKSTYMRQTALIVILAQMGSFVPAKSADVSLTDRIFARIGANDDLYGGRSTFMVEMDEMSVILKKATAKSLVILDEVGRGTSTFDGLSIAWAAVEHLAGEKCRARTLFATHYHELSVLQGRLPGVVNYRVTACEAGDEVIFLRKVVPGGEDKSYGIAVAKLAGLPSSVISRARQIMARLEVDDEQRGSIGSTILDKKKNSGDRQLSLDSFKPMELVEELQKLDVTALTPIEALNKLYTFCEKARRL
ncbi:MAG: DNA mismatch repair protein MutS [Clostridia bacterium]|nr:DNA mismatch repair protein MutS [Clostridia bacterium]